MTTRRKRRSPREVLAGRLHAGRLQAMHLPDSEPWLERIMEIERLSAGGSEAAVVLAQRLLACRAAEVESEQARMGQVDTTGRHPPWFDLYEQLTRLAMDALVVIGLQASEELSCLHEQGDLTPEARWAVLEVLARIADPRLEGFFRSLAADERVARDALDRIAEQKKQPQSDARNPACSGGGS